MKCIKMGAYGARAGGGEQVGTEANNDSACEPKQKTSQSLLSVKSGVERRSGAQALGSERPGLDSWLCRFLLCDLGLVTSLL